MYLGGGLNISLKNNPNDKGTPKPREPKYKPTRKRTHIVNPMYVVNDVCRLKAWDSGNKIENSSIIIARTTLENKSHLLIDIFLIFSKDQVIVSRMFKLIGKFDLCQYQEFNWNSLFMIK